MNREEISADELAAIIQEHARLKYQYRRIVTQDYLAFAILIAIFSLAVFIVLASAIFSLEESVISLVKEIIIIVSTNLATAIGVVYGVKDKECCQK